MYRSPSATGAAARKSVAVRSGFWAVGMSCRIRRAAGVMLLLLLLPFLAPAPSAAHDASSYGGLFRSRSMGAAWLNADVGLFLNAALVVAVDPRDSNHLLMGSDSGSVRVRQWWAKLDTGGTDADQRRRLRVAFSPDGSTVLCAAPGGIFRNTSGSWTPIRRPGRRHTQPRYHLQRNNRDASICSAAIACSPAVTAARTSHPSGATRTKSPVS